MMNVVLKKLVIKALVTLTALFTMLGVKAEVLTDANEIIKRANLASYYAGDDGRAQARMRIVDSQGRKQSRQFTMLRKDAPNNGNQDMLVFFERPSDVSGTVFRVEKHGDIAKEDNRWLYLPGLDLVKRISAGDNRTSFVGSHFFYEDVSGRNPQLDNYQLIKTEQESYHIKGTPKDKSLVEFDYYFVEINTETFLPMSMTYFNKSNQAIRKMQVLKTKLIDGFESVLHSKITDLESGAYTEMQFRKVQYNIGIPDAIFSERSLRNPPQKWMR